MHYTLSQNSTYFQGNSTLNIYYYIIFVSNFMYKLKIQLLGIINVVKYNFNFVFIIHVLVIPSC